MAKENRLQSLFAAVRILRKGFTTLIPNPVVIQRHNIPPVVYGALPHNIRIYGVRFAGSHRETPVSVALLFEIRVFFSVSLNINPVSIRFIQQKELKQQGILF